MPLSITLSERLRVLLADDNQDVLNRAAEVLSGSCSIVAAVTDALAGCETAEAVRPDVIVLDISMPRMNGLEVATNLRRAGSTAAVVFCTVHDDEEVVRAAKATGAIGYVLKRRLAADLVHAVVEASAGRPFVSELR
jgi:DNA-binding NarL/FixJ family response regulator